MTLPVTHDAASDARFMARALQLARRGVGSTHPNPAVGCVLVRDGEVVGEGFHAYAGTPHAEAHALHAAGAQARGATAYVTLEPCAHTGRTPPCADALIAAGVARVVAASRDADPRTAGQGLQRLRDAGIEVESGLMQDAARALNRGFFSRLERGRPFVTLKIAASLDGRTAMASGESQWITGAAARADVHRLRARHHAVMTSAQTVLGDDPMLTVRLADSSTPLRQPDRIVLDTHGRAPAAARVFADNGVGRWLVSGKVHDVAAGVTVLPCGIVDDHLDLPEALRQLGLAGINDVLVECGSRLAGALLQAQQVDELVLYLAPDLLGDAARPLAVLPGLEKLDDRIRLAWRDVRRVGVDLRITAAVLAPEEVGNFAR